MRTASGLLRPAPNIVIAETIFDAAYLLTIFVFGFLLFHRGENSFLFGIAAFILWFGDSFHLLPRIFRLGIYAKGLGKLVTSITMTLFYVILAHLTGQTGLFLYMVYILAFLRVLLCLLPQNHWLSGEANYKWSLIRNAPFTVLGILVAAAFIQRAQKTGFFIGLLIIASFACYLPVVLWANKKPALGMLMLPKSAAYALILLLGLSF
jgi:hypothetical protein